VSRHELCIDLAVPGIGKLYNSQHVCIMYLREPPTPLQITPITNAKYVWKLQCLGENDTT